MLLGATSWRIEDITRDRVVVSPAPGEPGKLPFWKAPGPGRPVELGRAIGRFTRELRLGRREDASLGRLRDDLGLDPLAAENLVAYVAEQADAAAVPDDRTIVIERFRDELGDWRVCILTPLGARVHAPWALAIDARLTERFGPGAQVLWSDDGIVLRLPEAVETIPTEDLLFDPDEIEEAVVAVLPGTALFSSVFREAAARALLLPRRRPGERTPLWQQRQRSADLLAAASNHPDFPILLETTRECLRDHFDVPALRQLMTDVRARRVRVAAVDTDQASPFARSLLFAWIAVFMYEGDAPLAERRAAALVARPRPAAGAARRRGPPRAARSRRARPGGAGAAAARRRIAARAAPTGSTTCCATSVRCAPTRSRRRTDGDAAAAVDDAPPRRPRDRRPDRRRRATWRRSRTPRGCATPSASRSRPGSRRSSPARPSGRSTTWSPATRARTRPFLAADVAARFGDRRGPRAPHARRARRARRRAGRRVPSRRARARVVASRRAAADPSPLARGAAPRDRAGRRRGARPVPPRVAGGRPAAAGAPTRSRRPSPGCRARRSRRRSWSATCSPRGSRGTGPADLDALIAAGDLVWIGAGAIGHRRRPRRARRPRGRAARSRRRPSPRRTVPPARRTRRSARSCGNGARRSGATSSPPSGPRTRPPCSARCGTWSGRAR